MRRSNFVKSFCGNYLNLEQFLIKNKKIENEEKKLEFFNFTVSRSANRQTPEESQISLYLFNYTQFIFHTLLY